jgi:predicted Zn-dependent peptidase
MQTFAGGAKGVDASELQRVTDGNIRGLPNSFQTNSQVLGALLDNQLLGRPDDFQARLPLIYRAIDAGQIDRAARQYLAPDDLAIVVVGDRKQIDSQLAGLGMQIEYLNADDL